MISVVSRITAFFSLLLIYFISIHNLRAQIPTNGLVAWYPLNGNAIDESGNGNTCTSISPLYVTDRFGNPNNAYRFQASLNNFLSVAMNQSLNSIADSGKFSLSEWFNMYDYSSAVFNFAEFYNTQTDWGWSVINHNGTGGLYFNSDQNSIGPCALGQSLNQWHHLVYTCDQSINTYTVYMDGQIVCQGDFNFTIPTVSQGLFILGSSPMGPNEFNSGAIDDVAIFSRCLSNHEVLSLYYGVEMSQIGCTDSLAYNYDANATFDDGSCQLSQPAI